MLRLANKASAFYFSETYIKCCMCDRSIFVEQKSAAERNRKDIASVIKELR